MSVYDLEILKEKEHVFQYADFICFKFTVPLLVHMSLSGGISFDKYKNEKNIKDLTHCK